MKLSAIVPTHNRPAMLKACLESLASQAAHAEPLEVVVVDDGSDYDVKALIDAVKCPGPTVFLYERQELAGLNASRNHGVTVSGGEILAFLDDDTVVTPGWAAEVLKAFASQPCAGLGGRVVLDLQALAPRWALERAYYLAEYDLGPESRWLEGDPAQGGDPLPVGANCAVRREDFERLDGFRSGLDRRGRSLISNGDTDFFRRLRASGGRLWYAHAASVTHIIPADRLTLRYFARRTFAQGMSDELMRSDGEPTSWRERMRLARLTAGSVKMLFDDVLHGRGAADGWFAMHFWAGRFRAYGQGGSWATRRAARRPL